MQNNIPKNPWEQVNDLSKYIAFKDKRNSKKWKILLLLFAFFSCLGTGSFFLVRSLIDMINFDEFNTHSNKPIDLDLNVDVSKTPIRVTDHSLRLEYIQNRVNKVIFDYASNLWWWKIVFTNKIDDFDFVWKRVNSDQLITIDDLNADGLFNAKLFINLKSTHKEITNFDFSAIIYNTQKFVENFMKFHHFEYDENDISHDNYLSKNFIWHKEFNNQDIYNQIQTKIDQFISDQRQEFGNNFHLYPVLTTNLSFTNPESPHDIDSYIRILSQLHEYYIDNNIFSQYVRLIPKQKFIIIYSPIEDIVLITKKIYDKDGKEGVVKYFEQTKYDTKFIPFVISGKNQKISLPHSVLIDEKQNNHKKN